MFATSARSSAATAPSASTIRDRVTGQPAEDRGLRGGFGGFGGPAAGGAGGGRASVRTVRAARTAAGSRCGIRRRRGPARGRWPDRRTGAVRCTSPRTAPRPAGNSRRRRGRVGTGWRSAPVGQRRRLGRPGWRSAAPAPARVSAFLPSSSTPASTTEPISSGPRKPSVTHEPEHAAGQPAEQHRDDGRGARLAAAEQRLDRRSGVTLGRDEQPAGQVDHDADAEKPSHGEQHPPQHRVGVGGAADRRADPAEIAALQWPDQAVPCGEPGTQDGRPAPRPPAGCPRARSCSDPRAGGGPGASGGDPERTLRSRRAMSGRSPWLGSATSM